MKPEQRLMRIAAIKQARERAEREDRPMRVFMRIGYPQIEDVTWYVRSIPEGIPEGSSLVMMVGIKGIDVF